MTSSNYIKDENPFNLAGPPKWWLLKLLEFDPSLVVVPSRNGHFYRLGQKRPIDPRVDLVNDAMKDSDTRMLVRYGLIPVTTILATANWSNPYMFEELAQRAPWRMGGAEKVNQMLEAQDLKQDIDKAVKTDERNTSLAKDGWKMYRKKIGLGRTLFLPSGV